MELLTWPLRREGYGSDIEVKMWVFFSLASLLFLFRLLRMALVLCCMEEIIVNIEPCVPWGEPEAPNIQKHLEKLEGKGEKTSTLQCRHGYRLKNCIHPQVSLNL